MTEDQPTEIKEVLAKVKEMQGELQLCLEDGKGWRVLPDKPTAEEMRSALENVAYVLAEALGTLAYYVENLPVEVSRLKGHRHDTTKAYSGRPEL